MHLHGLHGDERGGAMGPLTAGFAGNTTLRTAPSARGRASLLARVLLASSVLACGVALTTAGTAAERASARPDHAAAERGTPNIVSTSPEKVDTLRNALLSAYTHNPQLNAHRVVVRQTDEMIPQALSGYKPSVSATASSGEEYTTTTSKTSGPGAPATYAKNPFVYSPNTAGITASQMLFDGFQTANKVRAAETSTSAARETLRVAEQTILQQAATSYMDLLRDGALLELNRRNVEVLQEQLRQTHDRFKVGEVTRTDVAQTETQLAQGRATVLNSEATYWRSYAAFRQSIGADPSEHLRPGSPVDSLTPTRLVDAIEIARARHPSVGVSQFGIDSAVLQVKITEGSLYPQASLQVGANQAWDTQPEQILSQFNGFVMAQVKVPIYNSGPTGAQDTFSMIRAAKEGVSKSRLDLDSTRDMVQAAVVTAWGQLESAKAQIRATETQVASAAIALDGIREEAKVGQRTTFDILVAQQNLVNARTAVVTAQHDRIVASYTLLAAVGELNLPKLGINHPLYDPMVHYQQVRDSWFGVRTPDGR